MIIFKIKIVEPLVFLAIAGALLKLGRSFSNESG